MIREYLKSYFEKQRKQIKEVLEMEDLPNQAKPIHDLRMSFKRLRAFVRLYEALTNEELSKRDSLEKLGKLYKSFGKVRDLQIHESLVKDYEVELEQDFAELKSLLKRSKKKAQEQLQSEIELFKPSSIKSLRSELASGLRSFKDRKLLKRVEELLAVQFQQVKELLSGVEENKDNFHRIRSILKELFYVINIVHNAREEHIWSERLVYRLDQCTEEAGEWHDRELLLVSLKALRSTEEGAFLKSDPYKVLRKALKEDLESRANTLAYQIKSLLKTYRKLRN